MISSNQKRSTCTNYLPHQIKTQSWNEDNWEVNKTSFILTSVLFAIWNQSLNEIRDNHNVRDKFSFVRKMRWVEKPISTFEYRVFWWWNCSISAFYWNNLWSFAYEMASTREEKEILCAVSLSRFRSRSSSEQKHLLWYVQCRRRSHLLAKYVDNIVVLFPFQLP